MVPKVALTMGVLRSRYFGRDWGRQAAHLRMRRTLIRDDDEKEPRGFFQMKSYIGREIGLFLATQAIDVEIDV